MSNHRNSWIPGSSFLLCVKLLPKFTKKALQYQFGRKFYISRRSRYRKSVYQICLSFLISPTVPEGLRYLTLHQCQTSEAWIKTSGKFPWFGPVFHLWRMRPKNKLWISFTLSAGQALPAAFLCIPPQQPQNSAVDQCGGKIALILAGRDSAQPGTPKAAAWCLLGGCHPTVLISLKFGVKWLRPPIVQTNHGQTLTSKRSRSTMLESIYPATVLQTHSLRTLPLPVLDEVVEPPIHCVRALPLQGNQQWSNSLTWLKMLKLSKSMTFWSNYNISPTQISLK